MLGEGERLRGWKSEEVEIDTLEEVTEAEVGVAEEDIKMVDGRVKEKKVSEVRKLEGEKRKRKKKEKLPAGVSVREIGDGYPEGFADERKAAEDRKGKGVEKRVELTDEEETRLKIVELGKDDRRWGMWMDTEMGMRLTQEWGGMSLGEKLRFFEDAMKGVFVGAGEGHGCGDEVFNIFVC
ncbi:hypothetical protein L873DRAFT_307950 [Choiromyces venosus 120613-1]|uniref:Uncharacterized protein n=1 Tax=Choiromyces venosus 120613-1 TaxID=1336337 RepID=A0A3N4JCA2_9PEZI|nr:hypothetical protein L873DRAFT_307950 [Choiromyces venosus 120613-1]